MFTLALPPQGEQVLELLSTNGLLQNFYLAGGTALALHLGQVKSDSVCKIPLVAFEAY
ncbi:MAG: hypothetical protein ACPL5F_00095 [Moorellaceae bacterium]